MHTRILLYLTCFFTLSSGLWENARASHMVGEEIVWECLNACTTRVYLRVYRDCTGATGITNTINFTATNGCTAPTPLGNWSVQQTTEITPICPSVATACTTPGSPINGIQEYSWFRDYNVCGLGTNCTFDVSWGSCCRNGIITSGAANQGMGVVNQMDLSQGCNNSPQFTNYPLFLACAGQPYTIHQGAYDPDGDSLTYSLAPCLTNPGTTPVTYGTGYSVTAPLGPSWNVTLDPFTGMVNLTPQPGNLVVGVMCFAVTEWRNGNNIGTTYRDMQVQILNCAANNQPDFTPITNLSPGASLSSPDVISTCGTSQICFDISAMDADSMTQTTSIYWDQNIAGATFSEQGNPSNQDSLSGVSPDGRFCWTPSGPGVYQFLLTAIDNACPIFGKREKLITIVVAPGGVPSPTIVQSGILDPCSSTLPILTVTTTFSSYLWSTGATTQAITVNQAGTYSVTVSNGTCSGSTSINVVSQPNPQISGTIFTSGAASLANQKVYLIRHDASNNSLHAEDSTFTNSLGVYEFCGVTLDTMYVKAAPDSALYPTEMPTYADTAVWWNNAAMVLSTNFPAVVNFQTRFGSNPGGPGFIGGLISQGANKRQGPGDPMPNVTVILYSNTLNQFIGTTTSDANGYFSFPDLPYGDYDVSVDVAGVDNVTVPSLTLDATNAMQDSLDFRLHTTYFELVVATALNPAQPSFHFEAFPNPSRGASTILLELPEAQEASLLVYDIRGKQVAELSSGMLTEGVHRWTFDAATSGIDAGVYFLHLQTPQGNQVIKLVQLKD